jgi:hypothetical protein
VLCSASTPIAGTSLLSFSQGMILKDIDVLLSLAEMMMIESHASFKVLHISTCFAYAVE